MTLKNPINPRTPKNLKTPKSYRPEVGDAGERREGPHARARHASAPRQVQALERGQAGQGLDPLVRHAIAPGQVQVCDLRQVQLRQPCR